MNLKGADIYIRVLRSIIFPFLLVISLNSYTQSPNNTSQADTLSTTPVEHTDTAYIHETDNVLPGQLNLERGKLSIYPNPAITTVQVSFVMNSFGENRELTLVLMDMYGKARIRQNYPADENNISLDVSKMNAGTYIIIIHDEWGRFMSEKLVVL